MANDNQSHNRGRGTLAKGGKFITKKLVVALLSPIWGIVGLLILIMFLVFIVILVPFVPGGSNNLISDVNPIPTAELSPSPAPSGQPSPPSRNQNVYFYCQWQNRWSDSTCHLDNFGCVPTSLAMILSTFGDTRWNPRTVAEANGRAGCFRGTNFGRYKPWLQSLGYTTGPNLASGTWFDVATARRYLDNGYLIHAAANVDYRSGTGGHAFVISAIDQNGFANVIDPNFCRGNEQGKRFYRVYPVGYPLLSNSHGGNYWAWAYPIKKN